MDKFTITPINAALGAKISGLDLGITLSEKDKDALRATLLENSVLWFPGQSLSKKQLLHFSRNFGQPVPHPTNHRDRDEAVPEVTIVSNVVDNGKVLGALGNAELQFHADLVFLNIPGSVSILQCIETPEHGGETSWLSLTKAYDALNPEMLNRLHGLKVIYRHSRHDYNPKPLSRHPLLCSHPENGRKFLFFSPGSAHRIEGMEIEESSSLLESLFRHVNQDQFIWEHQWHKGDIVVWDNRISLHRRNSFDSKHRRIMYRTQMLGPLTI
ncbi:MAG: TauD/TfdA family dioxygenase [SAR324 cluster bacterium]|nr:TauD/TfdA family dioxygenase [SAR324 cluster bacterium]